MFDLELLWAIAKQNPRLAMNDPRRLMGRHCRARIQRAQAKRRKAGKTPFNPR